MCRNSIWLWGTGFVSSRSGMRSDRRHDVYFRFPRWSNKPHWPRGTSGSVVKYSVIKRLLQHTQSVLAGQRARAYVLHATSHRLRAHDLLSLSLSLSLSLCVSLSVSLSLCFLGSLSLASVFCLFVCCFFFLKAYMVIFILLHTYCNRWYKVVITALLVLLYWESQLDPPWAPTLQEPTTIVHKCTVGCPKHNLACSPGQPLGCTRIIYSPLRKATPPPPLPLCNQPVADWTQLTNTPFKSHIHYWFVTQ